ncbi:MAG: hypothetical protein HGA78_06725 [Nitrospirales bacterium]|nr:hypothetical protein [Nitrospirales bacterium]
MKRQWISLFILPLLLTGISTAVSAATYMPFPLYLREESAGMVMKAGQTIHLFHSGTPDVRHEIYQNDILAVYRISPLCEVQAVGRIRVVSYVGETYLKGEVVEGEIKPNDVAKKGGVSCLVISAGFCGQLP